MGQCKNSFEKDLHYAAISGILPSLTLKKSKRLETLVNTGFEPFLIGVNFEYFFYSLLAFIIFFI